MDDYEGLTNQQAELAALLRSDALEMTRVATRIVGLGHVQAFCDCGWTGKLYPTRMTDGYAMADKDAHDHGSAHINGNIR
jgi:hypothetical protein